jgi:hypothetical protein
VLRRFALLGSNGGFGEGASVTVGVALRNGPGRARGRDVGWLALRSCGPCAEIGTEPTVEIQEEFPHLANPLADFDDDYRLAVLHIAWDRHSHLQERTLLFAFVELLPAEIPPPEDDYDPKAPWCNHRLGSESEHCVYLRHAVTTAREALEWYLACRLGSAVLPAHDGNIPRANDAGAKRLKLAELGEEPPWPTLISASDDSDRLPFIPQWIQCPRSHHLLTIAEFDRDAIWSEKEQREALQWLHGHLHFDLSEYPEYWGSVHLIAPNPVYRELGARLQPRTPPAESVLLRFQPRAGKSVEGLEVLFREKDPWGVTASRRIEMRGPLARVNSDGAVNFVTNDVWDPRRGFLEVSYNAHAFLRSIQTNVAIAHRTVVSVDGETYEVMRAGPPERVIAGRRQKVAAARTRLVEAHYASTRKKTAVAHDQRWFRGQQDEARALLRSLLNEASQQVLFVDPYFGAEELSSFSLAVARYDIPIRVLSSAEVLREKAVEGSQLEKGEQLLAALRSLQSHERMNPFEVRVMTGTRPEIHDRFLAIDGRIWQIGSSLNEFGSRGTMMLALPDPDAIREDLESAWNKAQTLETWVQQRKERRSQQTGEPA